MDLAPAILGRLPASCRRQVLVKLARIAAIRPPRIANE